MGILAFIVVLGLIAIVHEYGHFVTARKSGIGVDEFGLGFPPRLWAKKIRGTEYSINLLPIGGFVRLHGEQSTDGKPDEKSFAKAREGR
jgi:regulator of sigma E protease